MNQFKNAQVIILPTDRSSLALKDSNSKLEIDKNNDRYVNGFGYTPQHLYIVNDDEIQDDDWCIDIEDNILFQVKEQGHSGLLRSDTDSFVEDACKKVIATTDTSLMSITGQMKNGSYFPQLSKEWIEYYISEYNKGVILSDVLVELNCNEIRQCSCDDYNPCLKPIIKINPDNTINIKSTKENWNREEVIELLEKISPNNINELQEFNKKWSDGEKVEWGMNKAYFHDTLVINDWIKENL